MKNAFQGMHSIHGSPVLWSQRHGTMTLKATHSVPTRKLASPSLYSPKSTCLLIARFLEISESGTVVVGTRSPGAGHTPAAVPGQWSQRPHGAGAPCRRLPCGKCSCVDSCSPSTELSACGPRVPSGGDRRCPRQGDWGPLASLSPAGKGPCSFCTVVRRFLLFSAHPRFLCMTGALLLPRWTPVVSFSRLHQNMVFIPVSVYGVRARGFQSASH